MAAYNFKQQFVGPIRAGTKKHTIRRERKDGRRPKIGEALALYCGMRTKGCFKILKDNPPCTAVRSIWIEKPLTRDWTIRIGDIGDPPLDAGEMETLARSDGFANFKEFATFWLKEHGDVSGPLHMRAVYFSGIIIHWR